MFDARYLEKSFDTDVKEVTTIIILEYILSVFALLVVANNGTDSERTARTEERLAAKTGRTPGRHQ